LYGEQKCHEKHAFFALNWPIFTLDFTKATPAVHEKWPELPIKRPFFGLAEVLKIAVIFSLENSLVDQ
jgi:hypothetical protein